MTLQEASGSLGHYVTVDGCTFQHNAYLERIEVSTEGVAFGFVEVEYPNGCRPCGPYPLEHIRQAWQKPDAPK